MPANMSQQTDSEPHDDVNSYSHRASSFLRKFVGPKLFTFHATLIIALRITCYGYFSGILTTLERRFQLSSSEAGTLFIVNDIAELCFIVLVSHFGHKSHRPRWIAVGSAVMGLGMLICAIPHFSSEALDPDAVRLGLNRGYGEGDLDRLEFCAGFDIQLSNIMNGNESSPYSTDATTVSSLSTGLSVTASQSPDATTMSSLSATTSQSPDATTISSLSVTASQSPSKFSNSSNSTNGECEQTSGSSGVAWIVFGQIVVGIGSSPMFPLAMSYIDDCVSRRKYTSYTAIIFMAFAIGSPLGLLMGAWATSFYVDFNRIPSDMIPDIPQEDPRWIGAWWLGLVVCFVCLVVVGLPMSLYPRSMREYKAREVDPEKARRGSEEERRRSQQRSRGSSIFEQTTKVKGLVQSVKRLITNVPLTLFCIGASAELASIGMFGTFGIKYIETQFDLSASEASTLFGGILIPVSIFSNIASSYVCRHYKLNVKKCAWFLLLLVSLTLPFIPIAMGVGCSNSPVAGVNTEYSAASTNTQRDFSVDRLRLSSCNVDCGCHSEVFQPVCGADGITYTSPCYAGCTDNVNSTIYEDCACIRSTDGNSSATPGQCASDCPASKLIVFVLMVFFILFFMSAIQNPGAYIIMRIVRDRDRSVAVGWKILVTKCFGYFPSPIYIGALINSTCTLWQYTCNERGSCWFYDIVAYRLAYFGTLLGLRIFSIICYVIMIWFLKDDYPDDQVTERKKSSDIVEQQDNEDIKLKNFKRIGSEQATSVDGKTPSNDVQGNSDTKLENSQRIDVDEQERVGEKIPSEVVHDNEDRIMENSNTTTADDQENIH